MTANNEPQATEKFFGAAVLQNCWIKKLFVSPAVSDT